MKRNRTINFKRSLIFKTVIQLWRKFFSGHNFREKKNHYLLPSNWNESSFIKHIVLQKVLQTILCSNFSTFLCGSNIEKPKIISSLLRLKRCKNKLFKYLVKKLLIFQAVTTTWKNPLISFFKRTKVSVSTIPSSFQKFFHNVQQVRKQRYFYSHSK